ncbi:MAG: hypothetical protein RLZZ453_509 [Chlamydiota bacterium]
MKWGRKNNFFYIACLFTCQSLVAGGIFSSENSLRNFQTSSNTFYQEYLAEQSDIDSRVDLGNTASAPFTPPLNPHTPPTNPPAPTPQAGYLPIVIVNDSGFADSDVYISVIGTQLTGTTTGGKLYMTFNGSGIGSYVLIASNTGNVPTYALSTLPAVSNGRVLYIPDSGNSEGISGGRIYFQINSNETLITFTGGQMTEPSVVNQSLASYSLTFDKFEFAYEPAGSPQVAANGTAVDFFSVPLYGYLSTPDPETSAHSGIYEPQSYVMKTVVPHYFNNLCRGPYRSAILAQWNNLLSPNASNPIRVLSPGSAMSVGTSSSFPNKFDPNYFDNAAAYGFSLLQYLWYGSGSYYRNGGLYFAIPASGDYPQPGTCTTNSVSGVYTASIPVNNTMQFCPSFTTESESYFPAPSTANATDPSPTNGPTTYLIFAAQNLNSSFAANLQGNQVSKLFEEAMIAGLLPTTFSPSNPLSNTYFTNNSAQYYSNSSSLPFSAGGPWYDLYSQAIHFCGPIYAFGFDEPLYPDVLMQCTTPTSSTYIGITIGSCDLTTP